MHFVISYEPEYRKRSNQMVDEGKQVYWNYVGFILTREEFNTGEIISFLNVIHLKNKILFFITACVNIIEVSNIWALYITHKVAQLGGPNLFH